VQAAQDMLNQMFEKVVKQQTVREAAEDGQQRSRGSKKASFKEKVCYKPRPLVHPGPQQTHDNVKVAAVLTDEPLGPFTAAQLC
jgi:hypothetical protein